MALLLRACVFSRGNRSLTEVIGLRYCFRDLSFKNDKIKCLASAVQLTNFSTQQVEAQSPKQSEKLIYYGCLTSHIRNVRLLSLMSTVVTISIQPIMYQKICSMDSIIGMVLLGTFMGAFGYISPIVLHIIMKKYITHIYYNEKTEMYTAETYTFFMRKKKINFTKYDVQVPDITGMFSTCVIKGKPMYLHLSSFEGPYHYKKLMGYDKPWDFKITDDDTASKNAATIESKLK